MLREVPGYSPHSPDQTMSTNTTAEPNAHAHPAANLNDDIFGSAPNSPLQRPREEDPEVDFDALEPLPAQSAANTERSDIPRLRSTHVTSGYRDGIAESKAKFVQEGFDEGFSLGAVLGLKAGWLLGVFEGVVRAVNGDAGAGDEVKGELREEYVKAREELGLISLFGSGYFGADGIWTFEVEGEAEGGQVTFREVADAHPLLKKWTERVKEIETKLGLNLGERTRPEEADEEQTSL